jgi:hypothetical protein
VSTSVFARNGGALTGAADGEAVAAGALGVVAGEAADGLGLPDGPGPALDPPSLHAVRRLPTTSTHRAALRVVTRRR